MCLCSCPDVYSGDMSIGVCSVFLLLLMSTVKILVFVYQVLMHVMRIPMSVYIMYYLLS